MVAFISVAYDSENDQFVITDTLGRKIEIRNMTGAAFATSGGILLKKQLLVSQTKPTFQQLITTSGVLTEATSRETRMTNLQDNMASLVIGLNGATSTAVRIILNHCIFWFCPCKLI